MTRLAGHIVGFAAFALIIVIFTRGGPTFSVLLVGADDPEILRDVTSGFNVAGLCLGVFAWRLFAGAVVRKGSASEESTKKKIPPSVSETSDKARSRYIPLVLLCACVLVILFVINMPRKANLHEGLDGDERLDSEIIHLMCTDPAPLGSRDLDMHWLVSIDTRAGKMKVLFYMGTQAGKMKLDEDVGELVITPFFYSSTISREKSSDANAFVYSFEVNRGTLQFRADPPGSKGSCILMQPAI